MVNRERRVACDKYPLRGDRFEIRIESNDYPPSLREVENPPATLFVIGKRSAVKEGIAIVGARKATPYGISCARRFSRLASEAGITVISGGAYGCDCASHEACLDAGGKTVAILGGGCDQVYPKRHIPMFQRIIDSGGAVISEHDWMAPPMPAGFVNRNRLIAGLAKAVLIVEAGMPSGTFSTADAALRYGKEVLVVPGAITSPNSAGCNHLLYQGAIPIIDDESFLDVLFNVFNVMKRETIGSHVNLMLDQDEANIFCKSFIPVLQALKASPYRVEQLVQMANEGVFEGITMGGIIDGLRSGVEHGLIVQNDVGVYSYRVKE